MFDDKMAVIAALVIIGVCALAVMGVEAANIITGIVSGLCGIAVGKSMG